ncbi:MAG: hypothetical protein NTZ33_08815 [Bacteroidetes bacterium]|nr:hypothetical protein [Bacteroidota bacterium]
MKIMKNILVIAIITLAPLLTNAQPLPPSGAGHGTGQNQPGNGAPLDGGLSILILLGAAFGSKKIYSLKKKDTIKE